MFYTGVCFVVAMHACVFVCVCFGVVAVVVVVVSVIVNRPVLPPWAVSGHSRNSLYRYYSVASLLLLICRLI